MLLEVLVLLDVLELFEVLGATPTWNENIFSIPFINSSLEVVERFCDEVPPGDRSMEKLCYN